MRRKIFDLSSLIVLALALVGAWVVWKHEGWDGVKATFFGDLDLFIGILPKVLAGCLVGAFIRILLPRDVIVRWLGGDSGLTGLVIATGAGFILPGGPFTVYPLAASLYLTGAGIGPVTAFVTSWTTLGIYRAVIWEIPFFGLDFVWLRMLTSLPLPFMAGYAAILIHRTLKDETQS